MRKIFLDCGGYDGRAAVKFSKFFPNFEIFSFEPNATLNKFYKHTNIVFLPFAVWVENCNLDFYLDEKDYDGSSVFQEKKNIVGGRHTRVQGIDFSSYVKSYFDEDDFIIVKMNIEGAEYKVLNKMIRSKSINYINELFIEFHYKKMDMPENEHNQLVGKLEKSGLDVQLWGGVKRIDTVVNYLKKKHENNLYG